MKGICPNCEKETDIKLIHAAEEINVRGELIKVEVEFYKCSMCGEEFEDPHSDHDPLDKAYREYRRRHGMIQPEEIRQLRKRYGFTQSEMSSLLGWGGATLSRYENGALQDDAHEKILHLIMDTRNLLNLIEENQDVIPKYKRECLIKELRLAEEESYSIGRILEERFGMYDPDELNGYRRLDLSKLFNAIMFFCEGDGIAKTVLNKLLFYADFKHFKDYTISITGARYARIPFGPAPDNYDYYFAVLKGYGEIGVEEIEYGDDVTGEKFISENKPDLSLFSDTELKILAEIKIHFKNFSAKKISDFSHNERGYKETSNGNIISYKYADSLQI